jgi:hypothetical protein
MQAIGLGVVRAFVPDMQPSGFRTAFAIQWLVGGLPIIAFLLVPEYVFTHPMIQTRTSLTKLDHPTTYS